MSIRILPFAYSLCVMALPLTASAEEGSRSDAVGYVESFVFADRVRTTRLYVPTTVLPFGSRSLIISLHGRGGRGIDQQRTSGFDALADQYGFVVAYPDGIDKSWNDGRNISSYTAQRENVDDVGFIGALIDRLVENRGINPNRVFITGISNGGLMAMRFACDQPDKVKAIGVVARTMTRELRKRCPDGKPVAAMFVMGTADPLVPYDGGEQLISATERTPVLSAEETAEYWARRNGNLSKPSRTMIRDEAPEDGTQGGWKNELDNGTAQARVTLISLNGAGHTWPSGYNPLRPAIVGRTSLDFHATRELYKFFSLTIK